MPLENLARSLLFPELKFISFRYSKSRMILETSKVSAFEVCPKCATKAYGTYDKRWVTIKDEPIRAKAVWLRILKRRFWCGTCKKPFTEPVPGIGKRQRTTERFRRALLWACENFENLKRAQKYIGCSSSTLYRLYYRQLEIELRKRRYPWPKAIGIDEHKYAKNREKHYPEFATIFVDHNNKRVFEVAKERDSFQVREQISHIPGRESVEAVTIDLSSTYRKLVREHFPNAKIIADKFHVVRLLHPAINRRRKDITGDLRTNPIRRLLLCNSKRLDFHKRSAVYHWLNHHPELREIYMAKEAVHGLYRIRGFKRAEKALKAMLDRFGYSRVPEVITLRKTLLGWRKEILEYFKTRLTNGRTEAFNGKAKLIRKKGYGFRSFQNYRLRLLTSCT